MSTPLDVIFEASRKQLAEQRQAEQREADRVADTIDHAWRERAAELHRAGVRPSLSNVFVKPPRR